VTFVNLDNWSAQSECGLYFVCITSVQGRFKHTAWFKPDERAIARVLGTRDSREEAEEICREHERQGEAA